MFHVCEAFSDFAKFNFPGILPSVTIFFTHIWKLLTKIWKTSSQKMRKKMSPITTALSNVGHTRFDSNRYYRYQVSTKNYSMWLLAGNLWSCVFSQLTDWRVLWLDLCFFFFYKVGPFLGVPFRCPDKTAGIGAKFRYLYTEALKNKKGF